MTIDTKQSYSRQRPIKEGDRLYKYWCQRYKLFSRFDDGIQLDEESWWSVTPEDIAKHIATRVCTKTGTENAVILDAFCGAGGNAIQFASHSPYVRVVCCDIDPVRLRLAKHNAKIYGVARQCEFILGDAMQMIPSLNVNYIDAAFFSPPWGGIEYLSKEKYSLDMMKPSGYDVVELCRKHITDNIAFLMPRNTDQVELCKRLLNRDNQEIEFEQNMIGKKTKTITAYFGRLINSDEEINYDDDSADYEEF